MLDKYQKRELKEFYSRDAGWSGIREMAKYLGVSTTTVRWNVNFRGYKEKQTGRTIKNYYKKRSLIKNL
jgi:hypothetical protein